MSGQKIGYIRVSAVDQNPDRQLHDLDLDKIFTEKASGKDTKRPELLALIDYAREGDSVFIHSMDRLARNLLDLRKLVTQFTDAGVDVHFVKENLVFSKKQSAMSTLLLNVMSAFAEFERSLIKERQKEGIVLAKKQNKYKGRKPALVKKRVIYFDKGVESLTENKR